MYKYVALKQSVLFFTLMLTSSFSFSTDSEAKQHLKLKLAELKTYQANFSQTVVDIESTVLQQAKGKIILQQPNKLSWQLFAPNESVLLADGDNIWNIDPFLEQVVVYGADAALENNPLLLLTNPDSTQWQEFKVSGTNQEFIITPLTANASITSLRLVFNDDVLVELESLDGQQQKSHLLFSDIQQNKALPSDTFIFVMPQGYELDDQR